MSGTAYVRLPPKLKPVFAPKRGRLRYRGAYGGRGSAKSFSFAKMAAIFGVVEPLRFLCTREIQESIRESFHAELRAAIASEPWLTAAYDVGVDYIRSRINDTTFLFKGLRHNIGSLKSIAKIDICIVEEAEDVPEASWLALEPTIRAPKSEIWVIWNPKKKGSPVDSRFRSDDGPPKRSRIVELNYRDNPWFPEVLEELRLQQKATLDPETYRWIWEGAYWKSSAASIMHGKWREETPEGFTQTTWNGPYHGLDFGFSEDPTAGVECWVSPDERTLYVRRATGGKKWELDDTADRLLAVMPTMGTHTVVADSARPESISYLKRPRDQAGRKKTCLPKIEPAVKGQGSVEDGIAFIRSFSIVCIEPGLEEVVQEFENYSYKVDRLTAEVLPVIVDAWNHYIDAIRYALERIMRSRRSAGLLAPRALQKRH